MKDYTIEQEKIAIDYYVNQQCGQSVSANAAHISISQLKDILKKNNIAIRGRDEAAKISNKNRALYKNEDYFDTESPNMAWLLGFLASDGSIGLKDNTIKIGLSKKDREILERIKEELSIENKINDYTTANGFDCSELRWTCQKHKNSLAKYNITPKKTFTLQPPYSLDKKYWIDYIRGYFDGDGSINLIKNSNGRGNGNLRWQVGSAEPIILQWIVDYLFEEYGIPKVNVLQTSKDKKHTYYFIQYSSVSIRKIFDILYTPSSTLFLKRKKDKFIEILNIVQPLNKK